MPTAVPSSVPGVTKTVDKKTGVVTTTVVDPGTGKAVVATVDGATGLVTTTITDPKTGKSVTGIVDARTGKVTAAKVDPLTGEIIAPAGTSIVGNAASAGGTVTGVDGEQIAVPADLASASSVSDSMIGRLTILLLILAIALPPLVARAVTSRKRTSP